MSYDKFYEARKTIEGILEKDLFGPVTENEIINDEPIKYYILGKLYPQEVAVDELETGEVEIEDVQESYDASISLSNMYNPSSMAITMTIGSTAEKLIIDVKTARYHPLEVECSGSGEGQNSEGRKPWEKTKWRREPLEFLKREFVITNVLSAKKVTLIEGLELQIFIQKVFSDGTKIVTVALLNKNHFNTSSIHNNKNSFFQPSIIIYGENSNHPVFIEKKMQVEISEDRELINFNMLYSHVTNYAVGHGCSVGWDENGGVVNNIYSTFMPAYNIKQMKPSTRLNSPVFKMSYLAQGSREEICKELERFIGSYSDWIIEQKDKVSQLHSKYWEVAESNLLLCIEAMERINDSINILKTNHNAFRAFQLANLAMLEQRIQLLRKEKREIVQDKIVWYPFQLAFMLQEIPSIVKPESKYRKIVDLIWFPTGGGKTEAYLGLSAFTIFMRRLRSPENHGGVTILMRYTLRLLTMQQFERAAALICACESIRRKQGIGKEEIGIGLWVGSGLTPNSLKEAEENHKKILKSEVVLEGNPCQLLVCPWCGSDITAGHYKFKNNRMIISCPNQSCEFREGLPVSLVDEDIYNIKPTLVIGTVDKFARMTWEPRIGNIFGLGTKLAPPELIIQDELHLISGPLGTVTGLYEIAIKKFCEKNNIGAKVIASTATIRNAGNQILSLYGSDFRQFPPQGINIRDSYFAKESASDDKPTRRYIGYLANGTSSTTTLVRVYACALFATRYLKDLGYDDEVIDSFWTMTGYFNSLRELGGAVVQVLDDVQDRFEFLYNTKFKDFAPEFTSKKRWDWYDELTSRKSNSEIAKIIQKDLKVKYPDKGAFDFILCSNMISVGVDVGRLGLMIVTGQPKTNAEYIQASSRVGREDPGLVLMMYNPSHSRDRSHFEQFVYYHSTIYKFVEATSLTPFSERARERGLHALYISLCRQLINVLRNNDDAANFDIGINELDDIEKFIFNYVYEVDRDEVDGVKEDIEDIKHRWHEAAEESLLYQVYGNLKGFPLLKSDANETGEFATLNSMRNVDVQSNIYLEEE